jgi:hypothetical protein
LCIIDDLRRNALDAVGFLEFLAYRRKSFGWEESVRTIIHRSGLRVNGNSTFCNQITKLFLPIAGAIPPEAA